MAKRKKYFTTIQIDRHKWGTGVLGGSLRAPVTGLQCCLGFACRKAGLSQYDIENSVMPTDINDQILEGVLLKKANSTKRKLIEVLITAKRKDGFGFDNSNLSREASTINDSYDLSAKEREKRIKELFAKRGVKVVFYGKPPTVKITYPRHPDTSTFATRVSINGHRIDTPSDLAPFLAQAK